MKTTLLAMAALACSFQALAQGPSLSAESFCADRKNIDFVKDLTLSSNNLMSFQNRGGIGNGGVCWWHSRFQRNALYLTLYKPDLPKPNDEETRDIVAAIRAGEAVVENPGYKNFSEYSQDKEAAIQRELEKWQKGDGTLRFAWVKGLAGSSEVSAKDMRELMDKTYEEVEINHNIAYNKLQIPGITSHAWSVVHMEKLTNGYNLEVLDSNNPKYTELYEYRDGNTTFNYHDDHAIVPAKVLKLMMDKSYDSLEVKRDYKTFFPGVMYRPVSIVGMQKTKNGGYLLTAWVTNQDTKKTTTMTYQYNVGDTSIDFKQFGIDKTYSSWHFTPYLDRTDEMAKVNKAILKECDPEAYAAQVKKEKEAEQAKRDQDSNYSHSISNSR